ncbi:MAG: hypothetical protein ABSF64_17530 [Bryobacteraceae bacterium]|jgi:hypothetical protein
MDSARYGTTIVLVNLLVNIVHGAAHLKLHIDLSAAETLFVAIAIVAGPLLAMALLWTRWQRLGFGLLALTMAGSLVFGLYHHFMAMGPDHVGAQVPGFWGTTFVITACLLFLVESVGAFAGVWFLKWGRTPVLRGSSRTRS